MNIQTIECDACRFDLTTKTNWDDDRIVLFCEPKQSDDSGAPLTLLAVPRPLERTYYFCGIGCLFTWLIKNHPAAGEEYEKLQKHRTWFAQHGHR